MKPLLIFILFSFGCQKYNAIEKRGVIQWGHDSLSHGSAYFCRPEDYDKLDTISFYYTVETTERPFLIKVYQEGPPRIYAEFKYWLK